MGGNFNIRLIVCDIEGCITPPGRGIINISEIQPLSDYCTACRNGHTLPPLVLCTGRQIPYAESVAQLIGAFFPGFPSIVENGAFLYDIAQNEVIPNPFLSPDLLSLFKDVQTETEDIIRQYGAKKEYGKEVCISLNPPEDKTIEHFYKLVQKRLVKWSGKFEITHSKSAVDITPIGINKGSGLKHLSEITKIDYGEMIGIGDTKGDLPVLNQVGIPTGPSNASLEVRQIARFIASMPGPMGVTEIIKRYTGWNPSWTGGIIYNRTVN